MATRQVLLHLPEELARRLRQQVPARKRSAFVQDLLERALPPDGGDDDPLYLCGLAVEQDAALMTGMAEWAVTAGDGFRTSPASRPGEQTPCHGRRAATR